MNKYLVFGINRFVEHPIQQTKLPANQELPHNESKMTVVSTDKRENSSQVD